MELAIQKTGLSRNSSFGFICNRCLSCCCFKKIQLNPYEIARLARNCGVSTADFIALYTENAGTILKFNDDGACIFLKTEGCSVHKDRPLVCRLYPLARYVEFTGNESFSQIKLEDGCQGKLHENARIEQFLEEQAAFPYMDAADLYLELLCLLLEIIKDRETESANTEAVIHTVRAVSSGKLEGNDLSIIDMDGMVEKYCKETGITIPESIDEKMLLHIKAVRKWATLNP